MTRVLVTGATGFIGRHTLRVLQEYGCDVHATYAHTPLATEPHVVWHQVDLLASGAAQTLIERVQPTHLLHLAWYVEPGAFWTAPENIHWLQASLALLQTFAESGGKRVVAAGTCTEYDWSYGYCREHVTPCVPNTLYGTCKHALHIATDAYAQQVGISMAWGRVFFLYGPHEYPSRLIASVIRSLLCNQPARCSHGRQIRDFLHVRDVADALCTLLMSDIRGPVNIASGQPVAIADIVNKIGLHLRRPELLHLGALAVPADDPPLIVADVRRLAELNWRPTFDLERGIEQTIAWWQAALEKEM